MGLGQGFGWCRSGDRPTVLAEAEAEGEQPAQVERGDAVVEPGVVLGHTAVAQPPVAADQPGDRCVRPWVGADGRWPGSPGRWLGPGASRCSASCSMECDACGRGRRWCTGHAAGSPDRPLRRHRRRVRVIGRVTPVGQVSVPARVDGEVVEGEPARPRPAGAATA